MSEAVDHRTFKRDHFNDFDLDSQEFEDEYDQLIEELPRSCPVARSNVGSGYYVLSRYNDVRRAGQDWKAFSSAKGFLPNRPEGMPYMYPNEADPPYQTKWRHVLNPFYGPAAVSELEPRILSLMHQHMDAFADRGSCEFVGEFAYPVPGMVFFTCFLGLPADHAAVFQEAAYAALSGPIEGRGAGFQATRSMCDELLQQRKDEPPTGTFVDPILAGVEYEGEPCPWEHKIAVLADIVLGGIATTAYVMAGTAWHLATHPEDRQRLVDDPALRPLAVEEFLRYFTVVTMAGREVTKPTEVGDRRFEVGDFVMLGYAAASRDGELFDDPGRIVIDREHNRHAAFGFGPHRCLGANLARVEIALALDVVLERLPEFRLRPGFVPHFEAGMNRHLNRLDLEWEGSR